MKLLHIMTAFILVALAATAQAQNLSAEFYGGWVPDRSEDYGGVSLDLDSGYAIGGGLYSNQFLGGTEVGLDVMYTMADYSDTNASLESVSAMAVARVPFPIGSAITGYAGGGLGAIFVTYDGAPALSGTDTVFGGQLSLGIRYSLASAQLFTEVKYQAGFDDATIEGVSQSYATTSILAGLRVQF